MPKEQLLLLKGLCFLAGYAFGNFLTAEIVARCAAGVGVGNIGNGTPDCANVAKHLGKGAALAVLVGDVLKTVLGCWFCYRLAAPELEQAAILYGGVGVVMGHVWPVWRRGKGADAAIVVCTWLFLYLPVTGALCCLAGAVAGLGTQKKAWGPILAGALSVPVAFLQFGVAGGLGTGLGTLILIGQYRKRLLAAPKEK